MKKLILLTTVALFFAFSASAQKIIAAKDAAQHIGEKVTICDKVFSTKLLTGSNMVFLDLGGYHPNQLLTVMIKGENYSKFKGKPEDDFKGKNVCITGTIVDYKGKPEIILSDPADIKINAAAPDNKKDQN